MRIPTKLLVSVLTGFVLLAFAVTPANISAQKKKAGSSRSHASTLTRAEIKQAQSRLAELGYGTGPNALIAFQKYDGREVTGKLNREEVDAITNASAPRAKDPGYKHVEVDLDRQVLLSIDEDGVVKKVLPVSTGSNKQYHEKRMSGLAYTPRGRFKIYAKIAGWRKSPLGMLYYPNYFSDGLAIHGNSSVPDTPESHGCVRVPNSAAVDLFRQLPIGTIVLIYDKKSFVPAKDWVQKQ
jgi:lipoprotein-anchoring transpeptidase ErfK/SrfK